MSLRRVVRCSFRRPGPLVPPGAKHLRGRSMSLLPGQAVPWHSTGHQEELILGLKGTLTLEIHGEGGRVKTRRLSQGQCVFLPTDTSHRVVNQVRHAVRYLYLKA